MQEISVSELKTRLDNGDDIQVIDIREDYEVEIATLGGEHLPMGEVMDNLDKIRKDCDVIVHCRSGARSGNVVTYLTQNGYDNLYNLTGGILAWSAEIDSTVPQY